MSKSSWSHRAWRTWVVGLVLALGAVVVPSWTPSASADVVPGDSLWVGPKMQGYSGSGIHGIFEDTPADTSNPGTPDYWGYCIEHDVSAKSYRVHARMGLIGRVLRMLDLVAVQTPQAFRAEVLRRAHEGGGDATDDAGLVERAGGTVVVVPGEPRNRKVTDRDDLVVLEAWLAEDDR